jgi:tetratricopeptide (TPR) repeat protein/CHAT domain-containing protein
MTPTKSRRLFWPFLAISLAASACQLTVIAEEPERAASSQSSTAFEAQGEPATSSSSDAEAAIKLAGSMERQQKYDEAIRQYSKALEIAPQSVAAHNNLAWLLATCPVDGLRNGKEAIIHATRACEITEWKHPAAIDTLSIAMAEDGRFEKAIELLGKFRDEASASEREKIDRRLAQFRDGKTYRQMEAAAPSSPATQRGTKDKVDQELQTLCQEAAALERAGRRREAAASYGKAVERAKEVFGPDHLVTAQLMVRQGDMYLYSEQFEAALPLFKDALPILRSHLPREHAVVTYCVNELASAYHETFQYEESVRLNLETLAVREAALGKDHPHVLTSLQNVASAHICLGNYEEGERLLNDWLERNDRGRGEKHPELPKVLNMLGYAHRFLEHYNQAEKCNMRALAVFKAQASTNRVEEAKILQDLAIIHSAAGPSHCDAAKEYARRALEITTSIYGKDHLRTAYAKASLANVYQLSGELSEAEPLLRDAVQCMKNADGSDIAEANRFRVEIARVCLGRGRSEEAERICLHCIDVIEEQPGIRRTSMGLDGLLWLLVDIAGRTGHQAEAEARLKRFMETMENRLGKENLVFAKLLTELGEAYLHLGSDVGAKESYQQCLAIRREKLGPDHPDVGRALQRLGWICIRTARFAEAEPFYEESLNIYRKSLGNDDRMVVGGLAELGLLYVQTNRYGEAEKTFQEAVAIAEKNPNFATEFLANALENWGRLCRETGRFEMAESLYKRALAMWREILGDANPPVAFVSLRLAQLYASVGRYLEAESLYRHALSILEYTQGKGHPDTQSPLTGLGGVLCALGRFDEAESVLQQSLDLTKTGWIMNDRDRSTTLETLAGVHLECGRWEEAIQGYTETQQVYRRLLSRVLPGLSPAEQMVYVSSATRRASFARWLSFGLENAQRAEVVDASAEWLLNGKALSAELLAEQTRLARQSDDPTVAETIGELAVVRGQLAHLVLNPAQQSGGDDLNTVARKLSLRESELSRQLGRQTLSALREDPWVTLEEVRNNLPAGSVLIEIAKFPVYRAASEGRGGKWEQTHYAAWVIPPADAGRATLVDLGDAAAIDDAVARCRQCVESFFSVAGSAGLERATETAMAETARLNALVWQPLEKAAGDAKSLVVSPDGSLWLYPWEALSDGEGRFLVEKKQISYVITGRQIAVHKARKADNARKSGTDAAIFADPDYDAELGESGAGRPNAWSDAIRVLLGTAAPRGLLGNATVRPLAGAASEADAFAAAMQSYVAAAPRVYRGKQASESEFKKLQSPRVLVISTHGFFLPDQSFDNIPVTEEAKRLQTRYAVNRFVGRAPGNELIVPNPLLRCGLALAGANRHHDTAEADDGVLTGLEILGADLGGTELVVLRACEGGIGAVRDAEGTVGLHYAFQLAGAETVVAALWSIPVKPSSELMQTFFDNLVKKQGKAEALRNAHVSLIEHIRKTTGSAHPALWAGFAVIGDSR